MRTRKGSARTQSRRRTLNRAKGYVGGRRRLLRTAKETLVRAGVYAFRDRRRKRRDFRRLWIIRLSAAVRQRGMAYNVFMNGLIRSGIELNRKILSEMAIHDPAAFDAVFAEVQTTLRQLPQTTEPQTTEPQTTELPTTELQTAELQTASEP